MAFFSLSVARPLQPWRVAGLRHWLFVSEDEKRLALSPPPAPSVPSAPSGPSGPSGPSVPSGQVSAVRATRVPPPSAPPSALRSSSAMPERAKPEQVLAQAAQAAGRSDIKSSSVPVEQAPTTLPVAQWSESWLALLAKSPPRPLVVWTYPALSDDYGGRSDPARRVFLQRIISDLAMPVGSNAFWPQSAPPYDQPGAVADPVFFHSGIQALGPAVVVFFGEVPERFGIPPMAELVPELFQGRRTVRVQPVDQLAANLQPSEVGGRGGGQMRHQRLVQFLKSMFPMR